MGIIRISAVERQGYNVHDRELLQIENVLILGRLMVKGGCDATALSGGMVENITPPYFTERRFDYFVTTPSEPADIAEKATVHVRTFDPRGRSASLEGSGLESPIILEGAQRFELPDPIAAFPLASPGLSPSHVVVHELLMATFDIPPPEAIDWLQNGVF